ncbi:MAG: A24 family peptidase [Eubacteriales bacterium]|nr:A24 family peptidase [Eubacteriales bacterium]
MTGFSIGIRLEIGLLIGLVDGLLAYCWFLFLMNKRPWQVERSRYLPVAMVASVMFVSLLMSWTTMDVWEQIRNYLFALTLTSLSATDWASRKIPNPTLAVLLVIQTSHLVITQNLTGFWDALVGLAIGFTFFQLPVIIGRPIGWGDVKLAAVIGYCLGWFGLMQSIAVMGITMGIFYLLLNLTRRGNLKTKVAIGPFLSIGMMVSVLFNAYFQ